MEKDNYVYRMSKEEIKKCQDNPMSQEEFIKKMTQLITEYEVGNNDIVVSASFRFFNPIHSPPQNPVTEFSWNGESFLEEEYLESTG